MKLHWNNNSSAMASQICGAYFGASGIAPVARSVVIVGGADFGDNNSPHVGQCMSLMLNNP